VKPNEATIDFDGFPDGRQASQSMATKTKLNDRQFMELAERAPKRSIAANMTIF